MVQAKQTSISKLLRGEQQLRVPLFQRHYQWSKPQWEDLWNDLARLAMERADLDPAATHFLGSLVLSEAPGTSRGLVVVDGQQRLITLGMLLCALRDCDVELGAQLYRRIDNAIWLPEPTKGVLYKRLRVLPTQSDREAYARIVGQKDSEYRSPVTNSYDYFSRRIRDLIDDEAEAEEAYTGISVRDIVSATLNGLECVLITAGPDDNAHRIFQSLNNTGLPLTQADLIRNYVFMRLDEKQDDFYEFTWKQLEGRFSPDEFTQLFWLDLILDGYDVTQRQTYVHQQRSMESMTRKGIIDKITSLSSRADVWDTILHPEKEHSSKIRLRLQRMKDWGTTTAAPTLMYLLEQRRSGAATIPQVARAMLFLESYFVRRVVVGRATMNMNRVLMDAPRRLEEDERPVDVALRAHLSGEGKHWAPDHELLALATSKPFYNHGRAHQKRLVLRWIEEAMHSHEDVLDPDLTVEHVMPQTLTTDWRAEIRREMTSGETVSQLHDALVHTIGNLTLAAGSRNTPMSNKSFTEKKGLLKKHGTGIQMTHEVTSKRHWGPEEIRARSHTMVKRIIANWPGPVAP